MEKKEIKEFLHYLSNARDKFCKAVNKIEPFDKELRVEAEDILIAFDQLKERYINQSHPKVSDEMEIRKIEELINNAIDDSNNKWTSQGERDNAIFEYADRIQSLQLQASPKVSDEMIRNLIQKSRLLTENIKGEDIPMFSEKYLINQFKQDLSLKEPKGEQVTDVICDTCKTKKQRCYVDVCNNCD